MKAMKMLNLMTAVLVFACYRHAHATAAQADMREIIVTDSIDDNRTDIHAKSIDPAIDE